MRGASLCRAAMRNCLSERRHPVEESYYRGCAPLARGEGDEHKVEGAVWVDKVCEPSPDTGLQHRLAGRLSEESFEKALRPYQGSARASGSRHRPAVQDGQGDQQRPDDREYDPLRPERPPFGAKIIAGRFYGGMIHTLIDCTNPRSFRG